ncbi:MAG: STAS domain-containing protein [Armatimonadota bacterium]
MLQESYVDNCSICVGLMNKIILVEVAGEIDVATVSLLAKALGDAVHSGKSHVILDAQNMSYIDSAGLQTLVSTQLKLESSGREMVIAGCHGIFQKLMKISQIEKRFRIFPNVDDAVASLDNSEAA